MRIRIITPAVLLAGLALVAGQARAADAVEAVPGAPTPTEAWTGRVVGFGESSPFGILGTYRLYRTDNAEAASGGGVH